MMPNPLFRPASMFTLGILFTVLCANLALYLLEPLPIKALRFQLFDHYQKWHPRPYIDVGVRIIDIDDASLEKIGQWPWPRTKLAEFIKNLSSQTIKAYGFDIIFAEPDRTSPANLLPLWTLSPALNAQLRSLPDYDQVLANSLKTIPSVLGFMEAQEERKSLLPAQPFRFITTGTSPIPFAPEFDLAINSLPLFEQNAAGNGAFIFLPDTDGIIRKIPLLTQIQGHLYPSFATEIVRVAQKQKNYNVTTSPDKNYGIEKITIGSNSIPTLANGEMWLYYSLPNPTRTIPMWKILNHEVDLANLENTIVLIGTSAKGLADLRFSPMSGIIPGVEVHAQAIEQMLNQTYLVRPKWAEAFEFLTILVISIVIAAISLKQRLLLSVGCITLIISSLTLAGWLAFTHYGKLLDTLTPIIMIMSIFILGNLFRLYHSEQRQRWIRSVFSRYVSPNLVNYLIAHPEEVELSAQRRECSFVMTDLANSTTFMEYTDPQIVAKCLNSYLDQMITIAFSFDGTLTRIVGDGIVIMFSAPVTQNDHRERAINCAMAMQRFAQTYVAEQSANNISFCETRIGVNTGMVLVGNFGGSSIFDYRALGDPINTASRLESANRYLGTKICIAAESYPKNNQTFYKRPIGELLLKGKNAPLLAYEPIDPIAEPSLTPIDSAYEHAYALLPNNPDAAQSAFALLAKERPHDNLITFHLARLSQGEHSNIIILKEK